MRLLRHTLLARLDRFVHDPLAKRDARRVPSAPLERAEVVRRVQALQRGWSTRADEQRIADLLTGVRGADLTWVKNALNRCDGHHDLEQLVYVDIGDEGARARILAHIAAQARPLGTVGVKVLSDIDDTVFARLHDDRWPHDRARPYPGVLAFLEALDLGPDEHPASRGDLTFLTARPELVLGLVESETKESLRKAGIAHSSVLSGGLLALRSRRAMAGGKFANVAHYRELFPEYDVVFAGDSGQGDVLVGERMRAELPDAVRAVFIHDVRATPDAERARLAALGVHVVDTYVGAAVRALDLGLISTASLERVIAETRERLPRIRWDGPGQQRRTTALVERDVADAASRLHR